MPKQFLVDLLNDEGSIFFERELEHIKAKTFEVVYADLQFRSLFPVSNEADPGATHITYQVYDKRGMAKIVNNYAGDLPRADVDGREVTVPVRTIGAAFGYSIKEIKAAQLANKSLSQMRANAVKRAVEEKMNDIAFNGDDEHGLYGVLTHPNIPTSDVPNGDSGDPEWVEKTPDEILLDINSMFSETKALTKDKEIPDTLLLPSAQWNLIATTRVTDLNMTIMQFVIANSPFISSADQIKSVPMLAGAGTAGVDVMVSYRKDPMKVEFEIPQELDFLPEQPKNLEVVVPASAECGGLNIYFPLSFRIKEKI